MYATACSPVQLHLYMSVCLDTCFSNCYMLCICMSIGISSFHRISGENMISWMYFLSDQLVIYFYIVFPVEMQAPRAIFVCVLSTKIRILHAVYQTIKVNCTSCILTSFCNCYCSVLYCIVLYCIVLYCIVLYCIVLYCIVLYRIVLYCRVFCGVVLCFITFWLIPTL